MVLVPSPFSWLIAAATALYTEGGVRCASTVEDAGIDEFLSGLPAALVVEGCTDEIPSSDPLDPQYFCPDVLAAEKGHPFLLHLLKVIQEHEAAGSTVKPARLLGIARKSYRGDRPIHCLPAETCIDFASLARGRGLRIDEALSKGITRMAPLVRFPVRAVRVAPEADMAAEPIRLHTAIPFRHPFHQGQLFMLPRAGPLVSCLMVSRGRVADARFSIECFRHQTYLNRELVIVTANQDGELVRFLETLGDTRIHIHVVPEHPDRYEPTLGDLRNESVARAQGAFVCTWDDDDLFAPTRLSVMVGVLEDTDADVAFLSRLTLWWPGREAIAVSSSYTWENSMMARREVMPRYPALSRGEDAVLARELSGSVPVVTIDAPDLFLYIVHGGNTCADTHFAGLLLSAQVSVPRLHYGAALTVLAGWFDQVPDYAEHLAQRSPTTGSAEEGLDQVRLRGGSSGLAAVVSGEAVRHAAPRRGHWMLALEMGSGFGHVLPMCSLAQRLLEAGHRVTLVMNKDANVSPVAALRGHPSFSVVDGPAGPPPEIELNPAYTYTDLLVQGGYHRPEWLGPAVVAWRDLIRAHAPDEVLADHAPTALLGARAAGVAARAIGTGFTIPPQVTPLPSFKRHQPDDGERQTLHESAMLVACNEALARAGGPPLHAFSALHHARPAVLTSYPVLDPYRDVRPPSEVWGPLEEDDASVEGPAMPWPTGTGRRVLCYVRPDYAAVDVLLDILSAGDEVAVVHVPDAGNGRRRTPVGPRVHLAHDRLPMTQAVREADIVVCHAGVGTTSVCLRHGVPMILLPTQGEQQSNADALVRAGVAIAFVHHARLSHDTWREAVASLVNDPRMGATLKAVSDDVAQRWPAGRAARVADTLVAHVQDPRHHV